MGLSTLVQKKSVRENQHPLQMNIMQNIKKRELHDLLTVSPVTPPLLLEILFVSSSTLSIRGCRARSWCKSSTTHKLFSVLCALEAATFHSLEAKRVKILQYSARLVLVCFHMSRQQELQAMETVVEKNSSKRKSLSNTHGTMPFFAWDFMRP
jgi:hypothetical protein